MITEENRLLKAGLRTMFHKLPWKSDLEREQMSKFADGMTSNDMLRYLGILDSANEALPPICSESVPVDNNSNVFLTRAEGQGRQSSQQRDFQTTSFSGTPYSNDGSQCLALTSDEVDEPLFDLYRQIIFDAESGVQQGSDWDYYFAPLS
ncbi:uncharacterized protein Z519_05529 [Cladophialophora bantiana CBS 173.52]|uniref:Uncharacterized protein n=1 Tax=Cladophialophora bantiana (strain ATCC 10958 / CBS 173.52 / CDC B-1940 / NIH 8579) TaxID=1442370 RepID=A0A0D2HLM3_CLAB1|nr:uncharacterized protein Z519_05529 [Cladophialophora bantiana CBS 173.52]KIW94213.1 hypothetical protein Z519_05529 [Cladophialophora bantiana CBS 173.52]